MSICDDHGSPALRRALCSLQFTLAERLTEHGALAGRGDAEHLLHCVATGPHAESRRAAEMLMTLWEAGVLDDAAKTEMLKNRRVLEAPVEGFWLDDHDCYGVHDDRYVDDGFNFRL